MRHLPTIKPPAVKPRPQDEVTLLRSYSLISPLFGGGVLAGQPDEKMPIRGTSIRGQLRFWWRATRGGSFGGSLKKMHLAESNIFGAAAGSGDPSKLHLAVRIIAPGTRVSPYKVEANPKNPKKAQVKPQFDPDIPDYATFPLQPAEKEATVGMQTKALLKGVKFDLELRFPKNLSQDVMAALWAFETFGGVGARTRRGFGALRLDKCTNNGISETPDLPLPKKEEQWIADRLGKHVTEGIWPEGVPHLNRATSAVPGSARANTLRLWVGIAGGGVLSWKNLIEKLKKFRQRRNPSGIYGRSRWPEPDAIRTIRKRWAPKMIPQNPIINKFPRAEFGLPILFHFKDEKQGDPSDNTLGGVHTDRLASRLILRPLACAGGQNTAIAVALDAPKLPPDGLRLSIKEGNVLVQGPLTDGEAKLLATRIPEFNESGPDVLDAFLSTL